MKYKAKRNNLITKYENIKKNLSISKGMIPIKQAMMAWKIKKEIIMKIVMLKSLKIVRPKCLKIMMRKGF